MDHIDPSQGRSLNGQLQIVGMAKKKLYRDTLIWFTMDKDNNNDKDRECGNTGD